MAPAAPLVADATTQCQESEKGFGVMLPREDPQKRLAAAAHLDELLDEALKATFPASDPIAIDVERQIARARNGHNARVSHSAQKRTQGAVDAIEAGRAWRALDLENDT
jgi:hypothetical protein